jgi:hypothetical protein
MKVINVAFAPPLMDREALALWTHRSVHTIRAKCPVHSRDQQGRPLYDAYHCADLLAKVPEKLRHAA